MARRMYDENQIKSIASEVGGGKLYRHSIYMKNPSNAADSIRFDYISSSNIVVDSLTDLKTISNNQKIIPCCGKVKSGNSYYPAMWIITTSGVVLACSGSSASGDVQVSITSWTYTDTVTEI